MAPGCRSQPDVAQAVQALADQLYPDAPPEVWFHPQCFLSDGHFAGSDAARADAFVEVANDPSFDALWWARGGYGAGRLAELVPPRLTEAARAKTYMGYSDAAALLAPLYRDGLRVAHGPMAQDIVRNGGEAAVARALKWLVERDPTSLEPSAQPGVKSAAFNIAILGQLVGTPFLPDLSGHVLMLEEVAEHMYRIDRYLMQITSNETIRQVAGIRLGRASDVPQNDPEFGHDELAVVQYWCERSGIPYLGRADIGHDVDNKVVPFGLT